MDIKEMENQIEQYEKDIQNYLIQMNSIREKVMSELTPYFQNKYQEYIENAIKDNPEITKSLGVEKLGKLKVELKSIIEQVPNLVSQYFNEQLLWNFNSYSLPNKIGIDEYNIKFTKSRNIEDEMKNSIRVLLGHVGKLIIDFGFEKGNESSWRKDGNVYMYRYGLSIPENIDKMIKEFQIIFEKLHDKHVEIAKMKKQKEETEAMNLWDQA